MIKLTSASLAIWLIASLVLINHAYGFMIVTNVTIFTPSEAKSGEEILVQAVAHTGNNLVEYVHDVNISLILPPNVSLTSGDNPIFIGEMGPGPANADANWTIVFERAGTYTLAVNASCIDSSYIPRWIASSATVEVYDYPHVEFSYTPPTESRANQTITFDASESYAQGSGREIVSYKWSFGDGTDIEFNTPFVEHAYKTIGNFQVSLEIADSGGLSAMATANITVSLFGDLNSDGTVNILDISIVAFAYGSTLGNERWNPEADTNHDGIVNIVDVAQVALEFGKQA